MYGCRPLATTNGATIKRRTHTAGKAATDGSALGQASDRDRDVNHVTQPTQSDRARKSAANRKVAVFVSLVATLSLTILLLAVLKTPPLTDVTWRSLLAVDGPGTLETMFQTQVAAVPGRWRYIYVHHSRTAGGDADALSPDAGDGRPSDPAAATRFADHFVIGNGDGAGDGEVQMTQAWNRQEAVAPPGATLSSTCISICVVGDFGRPDARPTPDQQRQLSLLVEALQARLRIPARAVFVHPELAGPAGVGRGFPTAAFRAGLLP